MGIEPTYGAWEAPILPLNYTRANGVQIITQAAPKCQAPRWVTQRKRIKIPKSYKKGILVKNDAMYNLKKVKNEIIHGITFSCATKKAHCELTQNTHLGTMEP